MLLGAGTPVDADARQDLRCLLAVSSLANSPDKSVALAGVTGAQYFFGRIDGRAPRIDLEGAMIAEAKSMVGADLGPLLKSCAATMQERGHALSEIGKRMQSKGEVASSPSS